MTAQVFAPVTAAALSERRTSWPGSVAGSPRDHPGMSVVRPILACGRGVDDGCW